MRLRYVGPFEAVAIPALEATVANGEELDVTGDVAAELLKRDDWVRVDKPKGEKGNDA